MSIWTAIITLARAGNSPIQVAQVASDHVEAKQNDVDTYVNCRRHELDINPGGWCRKPKPRLSARWKAYAEKRVAEYYWSYYHGAEPMPPGYMAPET